MKTSQVKLLRSMVNRDDYKAKLTYLIHLVPDHPKLERLSGEPSLRKSIMLQKIIDSLPPPLDPEEDLPTHADITLKHMELMWKNQFNKRNQLSNEFHICRSDAERKSVSLQIEKCQKKMQEISENQDFYKKHQELPNFVDEGKYPIPLDLPSMLDKRASINVMISRTRTDLRRLHASGHQDVIAIKEARLAELNIHKTYLKKAIVVETARIKANEIDNNV